MFWINHGVTFQRVILLGLITFTTSWHSNEIYNYPYKKHYHFHQPPIPISSTGSTSSTGSSIRCMCQPLQHCPSALEILKTAHHHLSDELIQEMRESNCGFNGSEPIVCCPIDTTRYRRDSRTQTTEKPWIWDVQPISPTPRTNQHRGFGNFPPFGSNGRHFIHDRFSTAGHNWGSYEYILLNHFNDFNINPQSTKNIHFYFHFEDPRNFKNHPPSISHEFELPERFRDVVPIRNTHPLPNQWPTHTTPSHRWGPTDRPHEKTTKQTPGRVSPIDNTVSLINGPSCGLSIVNRIIGGEDAQPGQFPWIARLAYRNASSTLVSYRCAGSVISSKYVLTAAHCVTNIIDELELVLVRLGELDTQTNNCGSDQCPQPQDYRIEKIIHHEHYDAPKYANDIALVRIKTSGNSDLITPLCLPYGQFTATDQDIIGKQGIIAGWGAMRAGSSSPSSHLQWLRLPIVNTTQCAQSYAQFSANSRFPIIVGNGQLCVQGRENVDACQGDSGGPLLSEGVPGAEQYTLIGIVSFGPRTCGVSKFPGVYTRVSYYMDWILSKMEF